MNSKNYYSEHGKVTLYKNKDKYMVYGNAGELEFMIKVNQPIEAEHIFNYWRDRIYVAPEPMAKDRVKLGMSPSAQVSDL